LPDADPAHALRPDEYSTIRQVGTGTPDAERGLMEEAPFLLVFDGGVGGSAVEDLVAAARRAAALDSLEKALGSGAFAGGLLITDRPVETDLTRGLEVVRSPSPFHFGRVLWETVQSRGLLRPVVFGAGALPLLTADDFAGVAGRLAAVDSLVITNNFYSSDLIAWTPGAALAGIEPLPDSDNPLPRLLHEQAGLPVETLPRTISTLLDIDTPTSLAALALYGRTGPRLARLLATVDLELDRYRRMMACVTERTRTLLVAGRVGSHTWQYLERNTACRVRLYAEERGMQADGREAAGLVRSLLGYYIDAVGLDAAFSTLAKMADAACIDSRVLVAHTGSMPSREDRFNADLGRLDLIRDPVLHDLTAAAASAAIPVLLGGHALVSGGLMALVQAAWDEHDRSRGLSQL
jgi:hypothetical protein